MPHRAPERTLNDCLGQLFMVGFEGLTPPHAVLNLIERERVGGVILFSRNCRDARQVSRLTRALQDAARAAGHPAPLLIAVDQENGLVRRLGSMVTPFPGAMALGATRSAELTSAVAEATGRELLALGINMNLAPVADINSNPANPVIGVRAFGQDPKFVAELTAAAARGYAAAGVISTLKHFPGHGDTTVDSHLTLPMLPHTRKRLERIELIPFRAGVAAGADVIMLAHLGLPALAPDATVPASLSATVTRLAREALGFEGVIMTDCLEMGAIAKTIGAAAGATLALQAGVDLVLVSHTIPAQRDAIVGARAALAAGRLSEEAVRRAAERVLALKARWLDWTRLPAPLTGASVSLPAHQRLSADAYQRSVTLARDTARLIPARLNPDQRIAVIAQAPPSISEATDTTYAHGALVDAVRRHHGNVAGVSITQEHTVAGAAEADLVIVALLNARRDPAQTTLVRTLVATGRPLIAIAASDPYDIAAFPEIGTILATYEYTPAALRAAVDAIFGVFEPRGQAPVDLSPPASGA